MHSLLKIFLISSVIWNLNSGHPSEQNSKKRWPFDYSVWGKCNWTNLSRPKQLLPENELFQDCFIKTSKSKDNSKDELPVIEWKTYLCILKESSVFPHASEMNFDAHFNFMTAKHPKNISDEIKIESKNRLKNNEKLVEPWRKVQSYAECFYRSRKQFCHDKFYEDDEPMKDVEPKCTHLAGHGKLDTCCKAKPTPVPLSLLLRGFVLSTFNKTLRREQRNCRDSFLKRQNKLQKDLNQTDQYPPVSCGTSDFVPTSYTGEDSLDLSVPTQKIEAILKKILSKKLRTDIKARIERYSSKLKADVRDRGQKTKLISNKKYITEFKGLTEELDKIYSYCEYMEHYGQSIFVSFLEYCTDSDYIKKTLSGFLET